MIVKPLLENDQDLTSAGLIVSTRGGDFVSFPGAIEPLQDLDDQTGFAGEVIEDPRQVLYDGILASYAPAFQNMVRLVRMGKQIYILKPPRFSSKHLDLGYSLGKYVKSALSDRDIFVTSQEGRWGDSYSYDLARADITMVYGRRKHNRQALLDSAQRRWPHEVNTVTLPCYVTPFAAKKLAENLGWSSGEIDMICSPEMRGLRHLDFVSQFLGNNARMNPKMESLPDTFMGFLSSIYRHMENLFHGSYGGSSAEMQSALNKADEYLKRNGQNSDRRQVGSSQSLGHLWQNLCNQYGEYD